MKCRWSWTLLMAAALMSLPHPAESSPHAAPSDLTVAEQPTNAARREGLRRFVGDDFGSNSLHATKTIAAPWKLYSTALLMSEAPKLGLPVALSSLRPVLEQFGFIFPDRIGNWPDGPDAAKDLLGQNAVFLGQTQGRLRGFGVEMRNNGCALCHAGRVYDANGLPTETAWIGLPNTSIDLQAYGAALLSGLHAALADEGAVRRNMKRIYPKMSRREALAYQLLILPRVRRELRAIRKARVEPLAFDAGDPGIQNGVASLKLQLNLLPRREFSREEHAVVSIPDLAGRAFRTSLLADGIYSLPGSKRFAPMESKDVSVSRFVAFADIVAFFSVATAGNSVGAAERAIPGVRAVLAALYDYEPPPFPGPIDKSLAEQGQEVFEARCTNCHGSYEPSLGRYRLTSYPNRLISVDQIGSDPSRAFAISGPIRTFLGRNPRHPFVRRVGAQATEGYVAPILSGLWATAPYLHNGSVPTLFALMNPAERPESFELGGHALDYQRMGIALSPTADGVFRFPAGYTSRSRRVVYDTKRPGRSNRGHESPFVTMSDAEKNSLIEFLKLL